jgi:hypothetical protein
MHPDACSMPSRGKREGMYLDMKKETIIERKSERERSIASHHSAEFSLFNEFHGADSSL